MNIKKNTILLSERKKKQSITTLFPLQKRMTTFYKYTFSEKPTKTVIRQM